MPGTLFRSTVLWPPAPSPRQRVKRKTGSMARRYTPENFRTSEELAAVTGRSARTARRWLRANPHIGVRIGGRRYVHADEVEQILIGTPLAQVR